MNLVTPRIDRQSSTTTRPGAPRNARPEVFHSPVRLRARRAAALGALALCLAGLGGCGGVVIRPIPAELQLQEATVGGQGGWFAWRRILILDLDGVLSNSRQTGLLGGDNPVSLFVEKLDRAQDDPNVVGVILRINSPGGSVAAVDIMARRLKRFKAARPGVPVVALIQDLGASGGYYLAVEAREIIALPSSITGSIGVIMQTFSLSGTMAMLGVESHAITSGPFKDIASPFKPLGAADRKLLEEIVNDFYEGFVAQVDAGRPGLTTDQVRRLADGRVYTGGKALEAGLVDALGDMADAERRVRELAGIADKKARLVMYHRPMGWRGSVEAAAIADPARMRLDQLTPEALATLIRPTFAYIWPH